MSPAFAWGRRSTTCCCWRIRGWGPSARDPARAPHRRGRPGAGRPGPPGRRRRGGPAALAAGPAARDRAAGAAGVLLAGPPALRRPDAARRACWRMPRLRRVRMEETRRLWLKEVGVPAYARGAWAALQRASPLGEALDPLRLDPPLAWGRMLTVLRFPSLARLVADRVLELGLVPAGGALAAALFPYAAQRSATAGGRGGGAEVGDIAFALRFLAHAVWLDRLFGTGEPEADGRGPGHAAWWPRPRSTGGWCSRATSSRAATWAGGWASCCRAGSRRPGATARSGSGWPWTSHGALRTAAGRRRCCRGRRSVPGCRAHPSRRWRPGPLEVDCRAIPGRRIRCSERFFACRHRPVSVAVYSAGRSPWPSPLAVHSVPRSRTPPARPGRADRGAGPAAAAPAVAPAAATPAAPPRGAAPVGWTPSCCPRSRAAAAARGRPTPIRATSASAAWRTSSSRSPRRT